MKKKSRVHIITSIIAKMNPQRKKSKKVKAKLRDMKKNNQKVIK